MSQVASTGRPQAGTRKHEAPSESSLFQMGSMEIFLEKQGYGESPGLSSEWELSPNSPPPSGIIPPLPDAKNVLFLPLLPAKAASLAERFALSVTFRPLFLGGPLVPIVI